MQPETLEKLTFLKCNVWQTSSVCNVLPMLCEHWTVTVFSEVSGTNFGYY